jgi:hypothetical protein
MTASEKLAAADRERRLREELAAARGSLAAAEESLAQTKRERNSLMRAVKVLQDQQHHHEQQLRGSENYPAVGRDGNNRMGAGSNGGLGHASSNSSSSSSSRGINGGDGGRHHLAAAKNHPPSQSGPSAAAAAAAAAAAVRPASGLSSGPVAARSSVSSGEPRSDEPPVAESLAGNNMAHELRDLITDRIRAAGRARGDGSIAGLPASPHSARGVETSRERDERLARLAHLSTEIVDAGGRT